MASIIRGDDNFDSEAGSALKAWVNFQGSGTVVIRSAYNVTSITDNGTGDYTINYTTPFADTDYSLNSSCDYHFVKLNTFTTTNSRILSLDKSDSTVFRDAGVVCASIHR